MKKVAEIFGGFTLIYLLCHRKGAMWQTLSNNVFTKNIKAYACNVTT